MNTDKKQINSDDARDEAACLLRDEANEMAYWIGFTDAGKQAPHRVKCAVQKEIRYFRKVANTLRPENQELTS